MAPKPLMAPLKRKPDKGDTALESIDLVVSTLAGIAALAPIPFVKDAAELVISLVDTIKDIKDNKEMFRQLVDDAYRLVVAANRTCDRLKKEGRQVPEDLVYDLAQLVSTLTLIQQYSLEKAKRGFAQRVVYKNHDLQELKRYREELKQAQDTFRVQTDITLRTGMHALAEDVAELTRGQTKLLSHFETDGKVIAVKASTIGVVEDGQKCEMPRPKGRSHSVDHRPVPWTDEKASRPVSMPDAHTFPVPERGNVQQQPQQQQQQWAPQQPVQTPQVLQQPMRASPSPSPSVNSISGVPAVDSFLANHPNPWVRASVSPASPLQQIHSPAGMGQSYMQHPYQSPPGSPPIYSPPAYSPYSPGNDSMSINSGNITIANNIGSNNDYSVKTTNFYGSGPQHLPPRGPSWKR